MDIKGTGSNQPPKTKLHKHPLQQLGLGLLLLGFAVLIGSLTMGDYRLQPGIVERVVVDSAHQAALAPHLAPLYEMEFESDWELGSTLDKVFAFANEKLPENPINDYWARNYKTYLIKHSTVGLLAERPLLFFFLSIGLGVLGGLLYILPKLRLIPGIKNNHIYHSATTNRGWIGWLIGSFMILFYILLYFFPYYITSWLLICDPLASWLKGEGGEASEWFFYGLLYTLAILVMGVRMMIKYRHSKYHKIRTASVMFFQLAFAFLIPELLVALNQPYYDLKNIWPLNYDLFFEYKITEFLSSGALGMFMLVWGVGLVVIGVPLMSYFYGKRWYCSWVCGCGGLAETLGDPYRHLSDKRLVAWKIERWMVHSVLVFAVVMTGAVLVTFFTGQTHLLGISSYDLRWVYGFAIGSVFAGVVGTGFYPLMGNRVWCRFGCPLAAYIGIVQRFKSRFRITTNGGQCISCGNCSTYCEMGIDVRWYAQRGQNVVRASCVGCGVCSSVCPRGVLKLEDRGDGKARFGEVKF